MEVNLPKVSYINIKSDLKINMEDKNVLIFAPNGSGKSTIYKELILEEKCFGIDYEATKELVVKSKKKLIIKSKSSKYIELSDKIKEKELKLNLEQKFKDYNLSSEKKSEKISDRMKKLWKAKIYDEVAINEETFKKLKNLNDKEILTFIENYDLIKQSEKLDETLQQLHEQQEKQALDIYNSILNDDVTKCPLCGTENINNLKLQINNKLNEYKIVENEIINNIKNMTYSEKKELLYKFKPLISMKIDKKDLEDKFLIGSNIENINKYNEQLQQLQEYKNEVDKIVEERKQFYRIIKDSEQSIKETMNLYFGQDVVINFDDENFEIVLNFLRDLKSYSTGEINFITFIFKLYEFLSGPNDLCIADDIFSSYDKAKQYNIVHKLISSFENTSKKLILLTHNIELIRYFNLQYKNKLDYYILDPLINNALLTKMDYNLYAMQNCDLNNKNQFFDDPYVRALTIRHKSEYQHVSDVFHYEDNLEAKVTADDIELSNFELINFLEKEVNDEFTCEFDNFEKYISYKVKLLAASRVLIEKKLFTHISSKGGAYKKKSNDETIHELAVKISESFRCNYITLEQKTFLMSKKVMLNDDLHTENKTHSFDFVLSIKLQDLIREVIKIHEFEF